jgi:PAS domain S-box-containing protein
MVNTDGWLWAGSVGLLGILAASVPVFDMAEDVFVTGESLFSTIIENSPLLALGFSIVAISIWLALSDWKPRYVQTVAKLSVIFAVGVTLLVALVVLVQLHLQSNLKPFIIAADAVVIGILGGVLLGLRTAQQERATDDAEAQRDRFQALFDNVPNPIVGVEFVGDVPIVRAVNPAFTEVFGFDRRTILDDSLSEYIVPPDEELTPVDRPISPQAADEQEAWDSDVIELETVDGRREFIQLTAPVDRGPKRDGYTIYIDVTAQRQRRERLRVLSRTLRHDIRNQLNVILAVKAVRDKLEGDDGRMVEMAVDAADELFEMTEQTREIERQIAGESESYPKNLADVVSEAAEEVRADFPTANITVTTPATIYADVTEAFLIAVKAVIRNGIEHNDSEDKKVEVTITEGLQEDYVDVRIADNGPGIDPDEARIVEGDLQTDQRTRHLDGLGLWTARWVVQDCGGDFSFSSNSPRGTIVTLRVPKSKQAGSAS